MRAHDFLNEIERIPASDYRGGSADLDDGATGKLTPLPGKSGLLYSLDLYGPELDVGIYEPSKKQKIGWLSLDKDSFPMPKSFHVNTITVHEKYRGYGIAKALYGIPLSILKIVLVSGELQTPGGRRNWISLSQIPGVEMKGYVSINKNEVDYKTVQSKNYGSWFGPNHAKSMDRLNDQIMQLGGQYIGDSADRNYEYWAFDVVPGKTELAPFIKNSLSKLYHGYDDFDIDIETGLYAVWTGR